MAYLFGFYLGDGWVSKQGTKRYALKFAKSNNDTINQNLKRLFAEVFLYELIDTDIDHRSDSSQTTKLACGDSAIAEVFRHFCGQEKAKNKTIPSWAYQCSHEIQLSLLKGLVDSDGWTAHNGYYIYSRSKNLIKGINTLCDYANVRRNNMVIRDRLTKAPNEKKATRKIGYQTRFSFLNEHCNDGFVKSLDTYIAQEDYSRRLKCNTALLTANIVKLDKVTQIIENYDTREVFDIEVKNNHNFIANNIVVHNSMATPWVAGVVALMMAKHRTVGGNTPVDSVEHVREHLAKTAIDMNEAGKDAKTGYGLVDVAKAIEQIKSGETQMPTTFDDLSVKLTAWVGDYNVKSARKDAIVDQINALQLELDTINSEMATMEATGNQINALLDPPPAG